LNVRAPLKEVGLTKAEIRQLSAELGLPTADKPQMACLSSRIPTGERVTPAKLKMVEQGEEFLRDLGFYDVRVRHHEMRSAESETRSGGAVAPGLNIPGLPGLNFEPIRHLARIEIGLSEMPKLLDQATVQRIAAALKALGYAHVTLDLEGYRRGSLNEFSLGTQKAK
jgi:uncharacterized protein